MKTEATQYSFADLEREGKTVWNGIANPLALIHLRTMRAGDRVLVYHSGKEKAVVGLARVTKGPYLSGAPSSARSQSGGAPARPDAVDLAAVASATSPVSLAAVRADPACADLALVRIPRLSVMPVSERAWRSLVAKGGLPGS